MKWVTSVQEVFLSFWALMGFLAFATTKAECWENHSHPIKKRYSEVQQDKWLSSLLSFLFFSPVAAAAPATAEQSCQRTTAVLNPVVPFNFNSSKPKKNTSDKLLPVSRHCAPPVCRCQRSLRLASQHRTARMKFKRHNLWLERTSIGTYQRILIIAEEQLKVSGLWIESSGSTSSWLVYLV